MITIENSNIVNWDNYPGFICAIVLQTNEDLQTTNGFTMPAGEEIIWLLDKAPRFENGDWIFKNMKINCLGGFGVNGDGELDADLKELHFKPKPVIKIKESQECYA